MVIINYDNSHIYFCPFILVHNKNQNIKNITMSIKNQLFDRESLFTIVRDFSRKQIDCEKTLYEDYKYNMDNHMTTGLNSQSFFIKTYRNFGTEQRAYDVADDIVKNTRFFKYREMNIKWIMANKELSIEVYG